MGSSLDPSTRTWRGESANSAQQQLMWTGACTPVSASTCSVDFTLTFRAFTIVSVPGLVTPGPDTLSYILSSSFPLLGKEVWVSPSSPWMRSSWIPETLQTGPPEKERMHGGALTIVILYVVALWICSVTMLPLLKRYWYRVYYKLSPPPSLSLLIKFCVVLLISWIWVQDSIFTPIAFSFVMSTL